MKVVEEIILSNDLVIQVRDHSKSIAADTTKVAVEIVVPVPLKVDYFNATEDFDLVKSVLGDPIFFTVLKERTFVDNENRKEIFTELVENFKRDSLPYIELPAFPSRFALSKLADIKKYPHRHRIQ